MEDAEQAFQSSKNSKLGKRDVKVQFYNMQENAYKTKGLYALLSLPDLGPYEMRFFSPKFCFFGLNLLEIFLPFMMFCVVFTSHKVVFAYVNMFPIDITLAVFAKQQKVAWKLLG